MKSAILLALAAMGESFNHQAVERAPIHMGYQHTTKKRSKPRKVKPDGQPEFKERNKKGRP